MPAPAADSVEQITRSLAQTRLADVPVLTERLLAAIFTDNPDWTDYRPVPRDDLRDGCRRYLGQVLRVLCGEVESAEDDVATAIGRDRAEQGVPLAAMLRTFRLGGRIVWEALVEQAQIDGAEPDVMLRVATSMWTVIDELSSRLSTSYRDTELERLRSDEQRRHALVEGLLNGQARDAGFAQRTAKELDLPTGGRYLVIVAEARTDGGFALRGQKQALDSLHLRSVWQVRADTLVGLVALERRDEELALDRLRPLARGRVAASPAVAGLAELGTGHQLALTTLGTAPPGETGLFSLAERFPEALLVQAPDLARRLVDSQFGPVLELPKRERDMLLGTLACWLEEDCSAANAAVRLHCHRNTVLNRLQRISTLIGRSLHGHRAHVTLSLALAALALSDTGRS
ncbi:MULTISPECIES: PucR family transcriptional regulator [Actinoalloteichus]|uniref:PucR C-terminal helix-turn-helix domain n=1 Tax=Actinoalloteichus fjordicus TaxID=1612552 RepID=A0AAC9LAN4_9PSEU|nr:MULTISPECIES: helix-turn-helix domain-containing protein [Actinoalloteichus]APU14448.1 PucR C-terminal helix-turn-helix domain [Actinoalloteichus fjordicus]APU20417.1 PucR C-terminal helix-turn-helix domain [Actinoalloteichus sp. GBA129-24]